MPSGRPPPLWFLFHPYHIKHSRGGSCTNKTLKTFLCRSTSCHCGELSRYPLCFGTSGNSVDRSLGDWRRVACGCEGRCGVGIGPGSRLLAITVHAIFLHSCGSLGDGVAGSSGSGWCGVTPAYTILRTLLVQDHSARGQLAHCMHPHCTGNTVRKGGPPLRTLHLLLLLMVMV